MLGAHYRSVNSEKTRGNFTRLGFLSGGKGDDEAVWRDEFVSSDEPVKLYDHMEAGRIIILCTS